MTRTVAGGAFLRLLLVLLLAGAGVVTSIVRKRKPQALPADDGQEW